MFHPAMKHDSPDPAGTAARVMRAADRTQLLGRGAAGTLDTVGGLAMNQRVNDTSLLRSVALAAALLAAACAGRTAAIETGGEVVASRAPSSVDRITASWSAKTREAATKLVAKYGQPDVAGDRMLIWYDKGPYHKIALSRDEQPHDFPMPHTDFLASTVKYRAPLDKLDDLAMYDGSVWFHRTRGELTAQCDMEELNNLALNLANDVATGKRTVEDARAFYAKTAMEFKQGKSSPYTSGLLFQPVPNAADVDQPAK
jgi:hypothetical protein